MMIGKLRVELGSTFGADAVREINVLVLLEINFQLLPVAVVVADFFARGADRQEAAQGFGVRQCFGQIFDQLQALGFFAATFGDVARDGGGADDFASRSGDGRDGHRNFDGRAVFPDPNSVEPIDMFAVADFFERLLEFTFAAGGL